MKVIIGKYKNYWGPYQIAQALCFWAKPTKDEFGHLQPPDWVDRFGSWLAHNKHGGDSWLSRFCNQLHKLRQRQIYVRIDKQDTWSMDNTLAYIILPMLQQLKRTKHGSPHVDDFDCPQHLWSTNAKPKENDWDIDEFHHDRWDWVLSEMIWAFEQECNPLEGDQFWLSEPDPKLPIQQQIEELNKHYDCAAQQHHEHRKQKAFQLFGKYYQALWD